MNVIFSSILLCITNLSMACTLTDHPYYQPGDYVFLSLSMPKASLRQWFHQARLRNIPIVLKGFIEGDIKKTALELKKYKTDLAGVSIDPNAYRYHHIEMVPALLRVKKQYYDIVYGNVSLDAAQYELDKR